MKLYEYADSFSQLFDEFDAIADFEPAQNDAGQYIDDDGNIIADVAAYKADMQQAWFDTLDGIEEEFDLKAENIAAYIKNELAKVEAMKKEEAMLTKRRRTKESKIERIKKYLLDSMNKIGRIKIDAAKAKISVRNNPESAAFVSEKNFIDMCLRNNLDDYLRYKDPEINKTAVKAALKAGKELPGASLGRTQSLSIK